MAVTIDCCALETIIFNVNLALNEITNDVKNLKITRTRLQEVTELKVNELKLFLDENKVCICKSPERGSLVTEFSMAPPNIPEMNENVENKANYLYQADSSINVSNFSSVANNNVDLCNKNSQPEMTSEVRNVIHDKEYSNKTERICRFFIRRKCKYGLKGAGCPFKHPDKCHEFLKNGLCQTRQCAFYHPKICYSSKNDRCCLDTNCLYTHLPGTRRKLPPSSITPSSAPHLKDYQNFPTINNTDLNSAASAVFLEKKLDMLQEQMNKLFSIVTPKMNYNNLRFQQ